MDPRVVEARAESTTLVVSVRFQMDPCGVEAGSPRCERCVLCVVSRWILVRLKPPVLDGEVGRGLLFQMDPCGIEVSCCDGNTPGTCRFRWTLVGLKSRLLHRPPPTPRLQMDPCGVEVSATT